MPQSFLVVLGVTLASLLAFQQTRAGHQTQAHLDAITLQAAATAFAGERLSFLESLPFDEATKAGGVPSAAGLTPVVDGRFVRTLGLDPPDDDLDDFNGAVVGAATPLRDGETPQPMTATITIQYVSEANHISVSPIPTRYKRVTIVVVVPGAAPVRLSQLYSCGGYCTW